MKMRAKHRFVNLLVLGALVGGAFPEPSGRWLAIDQGTLCVTEGAIEKAGDRLSVDVPKMRAYVNTWTSQAVEIRFRYAGQTRGEKPLASGEMRRQFGLKLRAQDACNLVYAMWRIEPQEKLVVSLKWNPNLHTSAQCGNRGYENIKPEHASALPPLRAGDSHTLRAEMNGDGLRVFADDREVWSGKVEADAIEGPVGIRTDNAHLEFELKALEPSGPHPNYALTCKTGPEAAE